jgi:vancomycin resistance protein YoaR
VLVAVGLLGFLCAVLAAWGVDTYLNRDRVGRNVTLAGRPIGGMRQPALAEAVARLGGDYRAAPVTIRSAGESFEAGAADLGLSLQQNGTEQAAMEVGRRGFLLSRIWSWVRGLVVSRPSPIVVDVDQAAVARVVVERDPQRVAPVEPTIAVENDRVVAVDGKPGDGIPAERLAAALSRMAPEGLPFSVNVRRAPVPPRFGIGDAQRLAEEAERLAADGLPVVAAGTTATVPPSTIRSWLTAVVEPDRLRLGVDTGGKVPETLEELLPDAGKRPVNAGFTVRGGSVVITPAANGTGCCAPEAAEVVEQALLSPGNEPVELPLRTITPRRDEQAARALGISEPVGTFTTNHAAGQPRVSNIHLIADLIRGQVIEPGQTFSVNDFVGPRTRAKGFLEAPIIDGEGNFSDDVGGGISQFVTTMFNAAFFAGLDIPTYGMHGLYIDRYPYGREATISYPSLDLKVRNNTPHGVLIWTSYTDTSITVTLYSTRTVSGEQTGQTTSPRGECTAVTTERTRTYTDGRTAVDRFSALYAPREGVKCT